MGTVWHSGWIRGKAIPVMIGQTGRFAIADPR